MINVSLLSAYSYCPRKIFLERILKLAEVPKDVMIKGTIRHEVFDALNKNEQNIVRSVEPGHDQEAIQELYRKSVSVYLRNTIIKNKDSITRIHLEPSQVYASIMKHLLAEIDIRSRNVFDFKEQTKLSGEELWLSLTPKIKSEYKVSSEILRLTGVIDQVLVKKEELVPVELKTGSSPKEGIWPGHRIQIAAYVMLLEETFDMSIKKGYIRYLDTPETDNLREVNINPFMREEVTDTRIKVEKLLSSSELPEKEKNEKKCEKCGLREQCFNDILLKARLEAVFGQERA